MNKPIIGVSGCLLGVNCRYDGQHKLDDFIAHKLAKHVDFLPFCPEDVVLGHPRESIRLLATDKGVKAIGNTSHKDYTEALKEQAISAIEACKKQEICGYVFKSKSPSCAIGRMKVYLPNGMSDNNNGVGIFAGEFKKALPLLPIEDEGRLNDAWLKENFVMQIFAYSEIQNLTKGNPKMKDLVEFHSRHKFLLLSKSTQSYQRLGQIVANMEKIPLDELLESYKVLFLETIAKKSSAKKVYNVLEHMVGFIKENLDRNEKEEFKSCFMDYKHGIVPLITPIKLLEIYAKKYKAEYILKQKFLNPYPSELGLRSEITNQ